MSPSGTLSSGKGTATVELVPAQPSARAEGPERSNKCLWQDKPWTELHPRKNPTLFCFYGADAKLRAVSSVRAICSQGGKEKLLFS